MRCGKTVKRIQNFLKYIATREAANPAHLYREFEQDPIRSSVLKLVHGFSARRAFCSGIEKLGRIERFVTASKTTIILLAWSSNSKWLASNCTCCWFYQKRNVRRYRLWICSILESLPRQSPLLCHCDRPWMFLLQFKLTSKHQFLIHLMNQLLHI